MLSSIDYDSRQWGRYKVKPAISPEHVWAICMRLRITAFVSSIGNGLLRWFQYGNVPATTSGQEREGAVRDEVNPLMAYGIAHVPAYYPDSIFIFIFLHDNVAMRLPK